MKHLVIGDPHATPEFDNSRFTWLGKFIVDEKPDVIICLGDMANMDSLSSYDKGKKDFENRRFSKDLEATIDAQDRLLGPLAAYNRQRKANKEKQYKPKLYMLGGNHDEGRIERVVQQHPELDGFVSIDSLRYKEFGWEYVPYRIPLFVDGIAYCHHFPSGPMGMPVGGVHLGHSLLSKNHQSSTVGHDHRLVVATETLANGKRIWGLSAGCYIDYTPKYAKDTAKAWWRGVVVKHNVSDGDYEPEFITINRLKEKYGTN